MISDSQLDWASDFCHRLAFNSSLLKRSKFVHPPSDIQKTNSLKTRASIARCYRKIPKISPGAYIFRKPFLRGLYSEGLIYGGKFSKYKPPGGLYLDRFGGLIIGGACTWRGLFSEFYDNSDVMVTTFILKEGFGTIRHLGSTILNWWIVFHFT